MRRIRKALLMYATTLAAGGVCFQVGGCNVLGAAGSALSSLNPCGTMLDCDPRAWEYVTSDISGPGIQPSIDPFCTYPPYCDISVDPIFGGISPFAP